MIQCSYLQIYNSNQFTFEHWFYEFWTFKCNYPNFPRKTRDIFYESIRSLWFRNNFTHFFFTTYNSIQFGVQKTTDDSFDRWNFFFRRIEELYDDSCYGKNVNVKCAPHCTCVNDGILFKLTVWLIRVWNRETVKVLNIL